jgi:hypothetical protein
MCDGAAALTTGAFLFERSFSDFEKKKITVVYKGTFYAVLKQTT